jgi:hypothetical protein
MVTQEEVQKRLRERKEAEKRNPLLKKGLGELIDEMLKCHITGNFGTFYYQSLVEEIDRRYPKPGLDYEINHDLIGKSLGAEGFQK